jgi:chemotaxis methyl-accepting protein methylase
MFAQIKDLRSRVSERTRLAGGMCLMVMEDGLGVRLPLTPLFMQPYSFFFRDVQDFEQRIMRRHAEVRRPVQILCVGCGNGQEAYSAVMLAADRGVPVAVLAVDRAPGAVAFARKGVYDLARERREALRAGDRRAANLLDAHRGSFEDTPAGASVVGAVRGHVRFAAMDADELPFDGEHDFVICRRMLHYLPPPKRRRAILGLQRALLPGLSFDHILLDPETRARRYF